MKQFKFPKKVTMKGKTYFKVKDESHRDRLIANHKFINITESDILGTPTLGYVNWHLYYITEEPSKLDNEILEEFHQTVDLILFHKFNSKVR
jgi:hypothetical protein